MDKLNFKRFKNKSLSLLNKIIDTNADLLAGIKYSRLANQISKENINIAINEKLNN